MKNQFLKPGIFLALVLITGSLFAVIPRSSLLLLDRLEYSAQRARLMDKIPSGVAIFLGATTSASARPFRQGHDFRYFTSIKIPNAYLAIDGQRRQTILFFTMD